MHSPHVASPIPPPKTCPICRADCGLEGGVTPNGGLAAELRGALVKCGNVGCEEGAVRASEWKQHQGLCPYAEVRVFIHFENQTWFD